MESTPRLYHTLVYVFSQHQNWVELRHLKTLAWMIVGLIQSGKISLTAWPPYVVTTNLFPPTGIVLWIGSSYAEALFFPR
jgi:hypothetical protein